MATLNTANLMLVIKATNDAAKVLKSVEGQLQQIVQAAEAANDAMARIAETAAPAMKAAQDAVASAQTAAPAIDTQSLAAAAQVVNNTVSVDSSATEGLARVGEVFGTVAGKAVDFLTTLGDVYGGIQALQAIFGAFGTDAEGAGNGFRLLKGPIDLVRGGFAGLAGLGGTLRTAMSGIGMAAGTAGSHLGTLASGGFTRLAALGGTLIPVIRGVGAALMTVALSPVGLMVTALAGLVAAGVLVWQNWDAISAKATEIWNWIQGFLGGVMDGITSKFSEVWEGVKTFFSGIWEGLIGIVTENWDKILAVIFPVVGLPVLIAKNWGAITEKVSEIWGMVVGKVQEWWNKLVGILFPEEGGLVSMIAEAWGGLVETVGGIWSGVADGVKRGVNSVIGAVEGMANGVIQAINAIIKAWNSLEFGIGGGNVFGVEVPKVTIGTPDLPTIPKISIPRLAVGGADSAIPAMASGGIIRRPTLALVGEAGPEAVIPLGRRGAGIAPTINVTVVNRGTIVHDRQFVDLVTRAYHTAQRQGRVP